MTAVAHQPNLACVVLSLGAQSGLVEAVRSLVGQSEPLEIVVVNSGGGDVHRHLRDAQLEVGVIDHPTPLLPGAVRNLGIEATRAPYVAFLAADCLAEPGWAAGRLREHHAGALAVAGAIVNAESGSAIACAFSMLLHYRMSPGARSTRRLLYGLSYDRRLFARFGKFREDLRAGEDTEFNARLAGTEQIAFARDVRTAHRNPTQAGDLLRDVYDRGRRRAAAQTLLRGRPEGLSVAFSVLRGVPWGLPEACWDARRGRLATVLKACLLLPVAASAYAAGAVAFAVSGRLSRQGVSRGALGRSGGASS